VDFDGIGYSTALSYLNSIFGEIKAEPRKFNVAPEWWRAGDRCIGVTHMDMLDRIAATMKLIAENGGAATDIENLPEDEASALELLCNGDTADIPGFDMPSAGKWIRRLRPNNLRELAIVHALHHRYLEKKLIEYEKWCASQPPLGHMPCVRRAGHVVVAETWRFYPR